ncbi:MAG: quinolinate synthase [Rhizobiales bacterium 32-66-11]|nr:MAG: quinolinate synthase [Rhizobiales bacterium 32-66-11]
MLDTPVSSAIDFASAPGLAPSGLAPVDVPAPAGPMPLPDLYAKVARHVPAMEWAALADDVAAILRLKKERNAILLAHNYQAPEIFHTVADIVGDSLALAREAAKADADVIVLAGVHFMAETAKILNPDKVVLIPDEVCCTSGNAKKIVEGLGVPRVIMIPDEYLARNIAAQTDVEIITWNGHCEVHELFSPSDITDIRDIYADVTVIAHPECPPDVIAAADFSGSTAEMVQFVADHRPARVALVTECSMGDNVAVHYPEIDFVKPCNLCPHMKRITLKNIRRALETMAPQVHVDPALVPGARASVERMLAIK